VERFYNSTLDEYVYRDIEDESSSEQSYRKCSCRDDGLISFGDEWNKLCPLEAQTCAIVYRDNEKDETHSSSPQATILCYTMIPPVGMIRYTWLLLCLWMCLVTVTLVVSEAGKQAINYVIIRTCGACCCLWSSLVGCFCTADDDSVGRNNPFVADFGDAYNSILIERTLQREARRRGIRISRWEIMRERMAIERGDFATEEQDAATRPRVSMAGQSHNQSHHRNGQGRTSQQWLGEWRGASAATESSQRRIDEWLRHMNEDNDEEGGDSDTQGSRSAPDPDTDTDLSRTRRRMRRKHGIQELALRTKTYCTAGDICKGCDSPSREADGGNTDTNTDTNDENEVVCIICFGLIENGDKVGDLPHCNHLFHASCLKTWIARKNACPMCMKPIAKPTTPFCRVQPDGSIQPENQ
jgi:hypothetical protein